MYAQPCRRYVQQNCLRSLAGLERLPALDTLNISSNGLASLAHLPAATSLATLIAEHNHLSSMQALAPLAACTGLHTLDLQHNGIDDVALVDLVAGLPHLACLYLKGNPLVSKVPSYRKTLISRCVQLRYLDERPVTDEERRCCEAWCARAAGARRARMHGTALQQRRQQQ